jgi:thiol-disulfide isomerase/thioredoxin
VLILFTASWCFTCIPEVNKMAQLQDEFGSRGLRQLVLSVDPSDSEAEFDLLRQRTRGSNLVWALDTNQRATLAYRIRATDTKVLINADGQEVFRSVGATALETLRQQAAATVRL